MSLHLRANHTASYRFFKGCGFFYLFLLALEMASHSSCCSFLPFSVMGPRFADVSSISVGQSHPSYRFGLSFGPDKRIGDSRKSHSRLRVSCLRDTKASVVTCNTWDKLILNSNTPVLVEFYASWCGPCNMVHRVIDEIATDYSGKLKCFVVDADCDPQVAENYDIKAVPAVLLLKDGMKRESVMGTMPRSSIWPPLTGFSLHKSVQIFNGTSIMLSAELPILCTLSCYCCLGLLLRHLSLLGKLVNTVSRM